MKECCNNCEYAREYKEKVYCIKHEQETIKDDLCLNWIMGEEK